MFSFADFTDYSLFKVFLAQNLNQDLLEALLLERLPIVRYQLDDWSNLNQIFAAGPGLFESEALENYAVDIQNLSVDSKSVEILVKLQEVYPNLKVYFYSSINNSLNAEGKKLWQKANLEYTILKSKDAAIMQNLAQKYAEDLGLGLSTKDLTTIQKVSNNYAELLDNLDFVSLAGDQELAVKSLVVEEKVPIFVLGFDPLRLQTQAGRWFSEIGEDEVQLALSLIFGKLDKNATDKSKQLLKKLILTDWKIKTRSKVNQLVWYRLFLWEAQNG